MSVKDLMRATLGRIADVSENGRGSYMSPGMYKVQIDTLKVKESENPKKKGTLVVICEFKILESDNAAHKPGTIGSWVANFDAYDKTLGNLKTLLLVATGYDRNDPLTRQAIEEIAGALAEDDPGEALEDVLGKTVALECVEIRTKDGNPFTKYCFSEVKSAAA